MTAPTQCGHITLNIGNQRRRHASRQPAANRALKFKRKPIQFHTIKIQNIRTAFGSSDGECFSWQICSRHERNQHSRVRVPFGGMALHKPIHRMTERLECHQKVKLIEWMSREFIQKAQFIHFILFSIHNLNIHFFYSIKITDSLLVHIFVSSVGGFWQLIQMAFRYFYDQFWYSSHE